MNLWRIGPLPPSTSWSRSKLNAVAGCKHSRHSFAPAPASIGGPLLWTVLKRIWYHIEAGHSIYSGDVHSRCFPYFTLFCRAEQSLQHMLCYLSLNFTKIGGRIHFIAIGHLHPCKLRISP